MSVLGVSAAAGAVSLALIAAVASAQQAGASTTGDEVGPAAEALPGEEGENLSPEEMLDKANEGVMSMERTASGVRRQLERSRRERDVVKVLCLNDKLNQIDVAMRSASDRFTTLKRAIEASDSDRIRHEFTVVKVLWERVRALGAEANQCIGEETGFVGESRVSVRIDPGLPPEDSELFPGEPTIVTPPSLTSPTQ